MKQIINCVNCGEELIRMSQIPSINSVKFVACAKCGLKYGCSGGAWWINLTIYFNPPK